MRSAVNGRLRQSQHPADREAYQRLGGHELSIERMMAWNVLTVLGDALWRTEAGAELPGGGTATTWVDDLARRLDALDLL